MLITGEAMDTGTKTSQTLNSRSSQSRGEETPNEAGAEPVKPRQ